MKTGAPTLYCSDVAADICAYIAAGRSLISYCKLHNLGYSTVYQWLTAHQEFADAYAHAKENQADYLADEVLDLADEAPQTLEDKHGRMVIDSAWVTNQKNRVDARKWAAAKLNQRKYGDKQQVEITGKDGEPLSIRLIEAQQRLIKDITPLTIEHDKNIAPDDLI